MNIKRRLIVSNFLMIVIPLAVSLTVFFGGLHLYAMIVDQEGDRRNRGELRFVDALEQVRTLAEKWRAAPEIAAMAEDVEKFNEQNVNGRLLLTIYKEGIPLTSAIFPEDEPLVAQALGRKEPVGFFSRTAVYAQTVGDYRVVLRSTSRFARIPKNYREIMVNGVIASLVCSVFIILLTNRFLTRFVFGKIVHALHTLTYGVHQIRDGNLNFRIDYQENDEFTAVCEDFNEMAARLLDSVVAGQKDEQSRKELIAGISHDLRTPLTSIKAYVEGIEKGVAATPDTYKRYIDTIKNKTGDLEHIIEMLFLFSKLDTGEFPYHIERVDLVSVVSEAVESLSDEYKSRGLEISLSRETEKVWVEIDAMQMRYIMINIFENSVKYKNKERGKMRVSVRGGERGKNAAAVFT
ncbi:MAG: HAMP domain-containing protein, partial [Synergistaceae bacterium]|nr:HAMP domain-containing protein [Synergistaceae bacterium]